MDDFDAAMESEKNPEHVPAGNASGDDGDADEEAAMQEEALLLADAEAAARADVSPAARQLENPSQLIAQATARRATPASARSHPRTPGSGAGGRSFSATPVLPRASEFPPDSLEHWGMPRAVAAIYASRGVVRMHAWQVEAMQTENVADGCSFVYSAPTSGGKSLVAELLAWRKLIRNGSVIFMLPFISMCDEKYAGLSKIAALLKRSINKFYGSHGGPLPRDIGITICTYEKGSMLVSRLIEADRLHEVQCVVVDELHMIAGACPGVQSLVRLAATDHAGAHHAAQTVTAAGCLSVS